MSSRFIILLALPLFWLAGCTNPPAGTEASRYGNTTVITGDFPVLARGMSVEEVRQKLGAPAEIMPAKSSDGNAEIWVYYLEKYLGKTQVVTYVNRPAPSGSMANDPFGSVPEPVYTLMDQKVVVTLSLLMLNGRLTAQTAKSEQRLEY